MCNILSTYYLEYDRMYIMANTYFCCFYRRLLNIQLSNSFKMKLFKKVVVTSTFLEWKALNKIPIFNIVYNLILAKVKFCVLFPYIL